MNILNDKEISNIAKRRSEATNVIFCLERESDNLEYLKPLIDCARDVSILLDTVEELRKRSAYFEMMYTDLLDSKKVKITKKDLTLIIPENSFGIPARTYTINQVVELLRNYKNTPEAIHFIADMMEV